MDKADERAKCIREIRVAQLLDAVFLLFYYNEWSRQWGPPSGRPPALDVSEALPALAQPTYEHALVLVRQMWRGATVVASAGGAYPEAKRTFKEEEAAFKKENPGFSEESYGLAIRAAFISLH